jgi:hypothetical protein
MSLSSERMINDKDIVGCTLYIDNSIKGEDGILFLTLVCSHLRSPKLRGHNLKRGPNVLISQQLNSKFPIPKKSKTQF